ncbi:tetratricopeptide repeat protein [Gleimia sp. 6138-11-ORH1]|uniref:tetratricopeptide repeat protein n=1 Tax=Gleimia sp. 6138-11-ORH1 TaxID=2973937 RepID=UPI002167CB92|nr:tetratricopeptide repeat protein [Gleimia sp. 6138-11-ORH1]MCS4484108.1 tetratricopeptide repeat protein [Gleimia sp. 6138-11-ORH1]
MTDNTQMPADTRGAVSLEGFNTANTTSAAHANGGENNAGAGVELHGPIIREIGAADLTDLVAISDKLPVLVYIYQVGVAPCVELEPILVSLVEELAGKVVLAKLDIAAHPQIAQALQVQNVPAVTAILNGRPLPLFAGLQPRENVVAVFNEVLNIANQSGLTGRMVDMSAEEAEAQNPLYAPARAAEDAGNLELALQEWELVLKKQPKDQVAKEALARLNLVSRLKDDANTGPLAEVDSLFASGEVEAAFEKLLSLIAENKYSAPEVAESARVRILEMFTLLGNSDPLVRAARGRLATVLF